MNLITAGLCLVTAMQPAPAQPRPPGGGSHPRDHDVLVHRVSPEGTVEHVATFERAGVATIVSLGGDQLLAAHQWFPESIPEEFDHIAVHRSADGGRTWEGPSPIQVQGLPVGTRFPFDPTIVRLADGQLRMYFTFMKGRRFDESIPRISSAISKDGVTWVWERGIRFEVENEPVIDCAVGRMGGTWTMIVPMRNHKGGYTATSQDGLLFQRQPDLPVLGIGHRWLGCLVPTADTLRFYGTAQVRQLSVAARHAGIWTADLHPSGKWTLGDSLSVPGADPGIVELPDGTRVVVTTGPARAGTPAARRRAAPAPPQRRKPSKEEVDRHLYELIKSSNELDWNRFARTFAPGATGFVTTPEATTRLDSGTDVAAAFKPAFETSSTWPPLPRNHRDVHIQQHGDMAIATFHADHAEDQTGWWTVVMRRENNQWKVQHLHASVQPARNSNGTAWP